MQEHIAAADPCRQQRPVTAAFAATRARDPLLVEKAAQVSINQTGRAIAMLNTSMFLGVALMQWLTGLTSTWAGQHGIETFQGALLTVSIMLALGALAFALLPKAQVK